MTTATTGPIPAEKARGRSLFLVAEPWFDDLAPVLSHALEALDAAAKQTADGPPSEAVRLAEAVSTARTALYAELIRQGWVPPPHVTAGIDLDEKLLAEGIGSGYDD